LLRATRGVWGAQVSERVITVYKTVHRDDRSGSDRASRPENVQHTNGRLPSSRSDAQEQPQFLEWPKVFAGAETLTTASRATLAVIRSTVRLNETIGDMRGDPHPADPSPAARIRRAV
jgi:hypothetical protein